MARTEMTPAERERQRADRARAVRDARKAATREAAAAAERSRVERMARETTEARARRASYTGTPVGAGNLLVRAADERLKGDRAAADRTMRTVNRMIRERYPRNAEFRAQAQQEASARLDRMVADIEDRRRRDAAAIEAQRQQAAQAQAAASLPRAGGSAGASASGSEAES